MVNMITRFSAESLHSLREEAEEVNGEGEPGIKIVRVDVAIEGRAKELKVEESKS